MRPRLPFLTRITLALGAAASAFLGHALSYHSVAPHPLHRSHLLESTGHGSDGRVTAVLLGVLIFACSGVIARRAARSRGRPPAMSYKSVFIHLLSLQLTGFLVMEVLERLHAGSSLSALAQPVIVLGVAAQVFMALIGALIVVFFVRLVRMLVAAGGSVSSRNSNEAFSPLWFFSPAPSVVSLAWSVRGPPASF